MSSVTICEMLKIKELPRTLITYLFCSPKMDLEFRCLPRGGGYLDQDYLEMIKFRVIDERVRNWQQRQALKQKQQKR